VKQIALLLLVFLCVIRLLLPLQAEVYPTGCLAYWQFDERSGNIASDSAGTVHRTIDGATRDNGLVGGVLSRPGFA
jgi:hypothetical protein